MTISIPKGAEIPVNQNENAKKYFSALTSGEFKSFVGISIPKFFSSHGAEAIPIFADEDDEVTRKKLMQVNGVVFPGGYGDNIEKAGFILREAKKINDRGELFPLFGVCLGLEALTIQSSDYGKDLLEPVVVKEVNMPLEFVVDPAETRMFRDFPKSDLDLLSTQNVTYHIHDFGITVDRFNSDQQLKSFWKLTTVGTVPGTGKKFVTTLEARRYPFYVTMFHPEKQAFAPNKYSVNEWAVIKANENFAAHFT